MNGSGNNGGSSAETVPGHVYFVTGGEFIKIGYSSKPHARLNNIQTGSPHAIRLLATVPGTREIERSLHAKLAHLHVRGEWFRDRGYEIIHLIERLLDASGSRLGRMSLLPQVQDMEWEHREIELAWRQTKDFGSPERRKMLLKHRLFTDLIRADGGDNRMRDLVRARLTEIENGTHPAISNTKGLRHLVG